MTFERQVIRNAGHAAEVAGIAAILGGNLFARVGMHPALRGVSDPAERGRVVNAAWRRYGTIESLSFGALVTGWVASRLGEGDRRKLSESERMLHVAKDGAVGAVALTGAAAAIQGTRFAAMEPEGAVPLEDGSKAAADASPTETRAKKRLNLLGTAHLAAALTLVAVNAALGQPTAQDTRGRRRRSRSLSIPRRRRASRRFLGA